MKPYWLTEDSRKFLANGYLQEGQTAEERIEEISKAAERILNIQGYAKKLKQYLWNGWISLSSPIWANFGTDRGLPISCNNSYVADNMESILYKQAEIGMMTKHGAGTSAYLGDLRPRGSKIKMGGTTNGPVHFMELFQTQIQIISQSSIRRGNAAIYLDVEHPDIEEFLECREEGHPIQHLSLGVCISDSWMNDMIQGDEKKRKIWLRIIRKRFETGYPYIVFTDTVNRNKPKRYKELGLKINGSNLCSEIMLVSNDNWSYVCDLLSLNDLHYDDWKHTDLVETAALLLDAVMEEYIQKTKNIKFMEAAYKFAKDWRSIGIGRLGWHSYLQSKGISFESDIAKQLNIEIQSFIDFKSLEASKWAAETYGEPEMMRGTGERWITRQAIAPTTSSSFILGAVSPSIEPLDSNYFVKDLAKGKFTYKNPYLEKLLQEKGMNTPEIWKSILISGGSVAHLDFLNPVEKSVFKTFAEIDQNVIIDQAADRQRYIDQSQSLNIKIHPDTSVKSVSDLMIRAWKKEVKSLYYQRSVNLSQEYARENVKNKNIITSKPILQEQDNCAVCEV